jgi:hypothetical protein
MSPQGAVNRVTICKHNDSVFRSSLGGKSRRPPRSFRIGAAMYQIAASVFHFEEATLRHLRLLSNVARHDYLGRGHSIVKLPGVVAVVFSRHGSNANALTRCGHAILNSSCESNAVVRIWR